MAASMRHAAAGVGAPIGVVLEGGYALGALARSTVVTLDALAAVVAPPVPEVPVHARAQEALGRLSERWDLG